MKISVTDAKGQLTELVRRAESGEDIVLTPHGQNAARIVPARNPPGRKARRALLDSLRATASMKATKGPTAARSQDFLYDRDGLPG